MAGKTRIGDKTFDIKQGEILEGFDIEGNLIFKITDTGEVFPNPLNNQQIKEISTSGTFNLNLNDYAVFCNTNTGDITLNLPFGTNGNSYKIINSGNSGNNVIVIPFGSEKLIGVNEQKTLDDKNTIDLTYNSNDGWY